MNNWKVIPTIVLATVLIFGAGVFTGGMVVNYVKSGHPRGGLWRAGAPAHTTTGPVATNAGPGRPVRPPAILGKEFLPQLDGELRLSKEEHEAIQKIISDGQNEMRKTVEDARLEMREVLTADQRQQFDNLVKRPFHKPLFGTNAPPVAVAPAAAPMAPTNAPPPSP